MAIASYIEFTILLWPALLLLALLTTVLMPDRLGGQKDRVITLTGGLWVVSLLWCVPIYLILSVPFKGDFDKVQFFATVGHVLRGAAAHLASPWLLCILAGYGVAGLAWTIAYFWIYARRLGQQYVMERDGWMRTNNLSSLEGLTQAQRKSFKQVLEAVQAEMLYDGDFPLRPLQQKRFFAANLTLWPVTLLVYLVGDMALDVARQIWFAMRNWIHSRWEKGMAEYLADDALCRARMAAFKASAQEAQA